MSEVLPARYTNHETMGCPRCHGSGEIPLPQSAVNILRLLRSSSAPMTGSEVAARLGMTHQNADGRLVLLETAGHAVRGLRGADGYEWTDTQRTLPTADDVRGILR
jgi:hypothetical protein